MHIRTVAGALLLIAACASAQAASLALVPSANPVVEDGAFTVNLVLNATDAPGIHPGLHSGAISVDFNSTLLTFNGFTLANGLILFSPLTVTTNGTAKTITLGFQNAPDTGTVGTFAFTATGPAGSLATLGLVDADDLFGSFVNKAVSDQPYVPGFAGTQVSIAPVPLPAGIWLLGTAVGTLTACRRLKPGCPKPR
jgi:hypothetical protein